MIDLERHLAEFGELGYTVIPNAVGTEHLTTLSRIMDQLTADDQRRIYNIADILGTHDEFLGLIDLPTVLPVVRQLLGDNIWVNHSHYNVNPPDDVVNPMERTRGYGWHRDGGVINEDLPKPGPLLSIKIAFYITDVIEPDSGQTYVITGSHKTGDKTPANDELPDSAIPVCVPAGSALLFDRRMIHSIRSPNESDVTRKVVFIQYAYRWICAVDAMTVEHLFDRCDPVRRQLLGLTPNVTVVDGAEGRSSRYYPGPRDIPLSNPPSDLGKRIVGFASRKIRQAVAKFR
ncbi:MAG: phytanoyl-CoA dioxygenase family protein [Woeseiaceae bacterium]